MQSLACLCRSLAQPLHAQRKLTFLLFLEAAGADAQQKQQQVSRETSRQPAPMQVRMKKRAFLSQKAFQHTPESCRLFSLVVHLKSVVSLGGEGGGRKGKQWDDQIRGRMQLGEKLRREGGGRPPAEWLRRLISCVSPHSANATHSGTVLIRPATSRAVQGKGEEMEGKWVRAEASKQHTAGVIPATPWQPMQRAACTGARSETLHAS